MSAVTDDRHGATRPGAARRSGDVYSSRKKADRVHAWLTSQPRDENGDIVASQRDISDGTGIPLPTVRRALRLLLDTDRLVLVELGTGYPYSSRWRPGDEPRVSARPASLGDPAA